MKTKKLSLFKRMFVLFCCTLLLFSSIFVSYNTTIYASETEWDDAAKAGLVIAGTMAFLLFQPEITAAILIPSLVDIGISSVTIGKYIYENSDGTYTIDPELVQAVVDAAQQLEAQGFTDADVKRQGEGYLQTYKWTVSNSYMYNDPSKNTPVSCHDTYIRSREVKGRIAGFNSVYTNSPSSGRTVTSYTHTVYDKSINVVTAGGQGIFVAGGDVSKRDISSSAGDSLTLFDGSQPYDCYSGSSSFGGNFPIFSTYEAMSNYLYTGQGYKDAENYRPTPIFRRHSSYTPTYSGGAITVNRTVIENITQKITEVDADDSLTDDQKIEKLQDYIRTGGTGDTGGDGGGGTGGGSDDTDYDDNKDIPSGTELTDTNSWLKKIYLKVCQIFNKISEITTGAIDTVNAKLQETLDEILSTLKSIRRWTIADTVFDGVDAFADVASFLKDFLTAPAAAIGTAASSLGETANMLTDKFPFSIPWDMAALVTLLSAEPQAPVFKLPITIESAGIEEYMEIDMSQFEYLSTLMRGMLSILYAYGILSMTTKVMDIGGKK